MQRIKRKRIKVIGVLLSILLFTGLVHAEYVQYSVSDISDAVTDWGWTATIDDGLVVWNSEENLWFYNSNIPGATATEVPLARPIHSTLALEQGLALWTSLQGPIGPAAIPAQIHYWNYNEDPANVVQLTPNSTVTHFNVSSSGPWLVWQSVETDNQEIPQSDIWRLHNFDAVNLSNDWQRQDVDPAIDGNQVVWSSREYDPVTYDPIGPSDIYYHDGNVKHLVPTAPGSDNTHPNLYDGKIVWEQHFGDQNTQIAYIDYNKNVPLVHILSESSTYNASPQIDGNIVTWHGVSDGYFQIFYYDVTQVGNPHYHPVQVTDDYIHHSAPQVHNGYLMWTRMDVFGTDFSDYDVTRLYDVFVYPLLYEQDPIQLTSNTPSEEVWSVNMDSGDVVWFLAQNSVISRVQMAKVNVVPRPYSNCDGEGYPYGESDCVQRILFVPFCWDNQYNWTPNDNGGFDSTAIPYESEDEKQRSFEAAVKRNSRAFQEANVLRECGDLPYATGMRTYWFGQVPVAEMEGYTDCANFIEPDPVITYLDGNTSFNSDEWTYIVIMKGSIDNNTGGVGGRLAGNATIFGTGGFWEVVPGERFILPHELGHARGLDDEYETDATPNELLPVLGCDPDGECCDHPYPDPLNPTMDLCLGNFATDVSDWNWNDYDFVNDFGTMPPNFPVRDFPDDGWENPQSMHNYNEETYQGRCIMSNVTAHGSLHHERGFCQSCLKELYKTGFACNSSVSPAYPDVYPQIKTARAVRGLIDSDGQMTISKTDVREFQIPYQNDEVLGDVVVAATDRLGVLLKEVDVPRTRDTLDSENDSRFFRTIIPLDDAVDERVVLTALQDENQTTQVTLGGEPPVAVATDIAVPCSTLGGAVVVLDGRQSYDTDGDTIYYEWTADGISFDDAQSSTPTATFPVGTTAAQLKVYDAEGYFDVVDFTVTVDGSAGPIFGDVQEVIGTTCDPSLGEINISAPAVTGVCGEATVTGTVIESNGVPVSIPVPENGTVVLPAGLHIVEWVAMDVAGQTAATTQVVELRPALFAEDSVMLQNGSSIRDGQGGFAGVVAGGASGVWMETGAETGSIHSVDTITLKWGATIHGDVVTESFVQNWGGTIEGTESIGTVDVPPVPSVSVTITPNAPGFTVDPGQSAPLPEGEYNQVTVHNGATLTVESGEYYMDSLTINDGGRLVAQSPVGDPAPIIYLKRYFNHHGAVEASGGTGLQLLYANSSDLFVQHDFAGKIVAPNAKVVVRGNFVGEVAAQKIEVGAYWNLTCQTMGSIEDPLPGTCGDGNVDAGEECDDGNVVSGDGCSTGCTIEPPGCSVASARDLGAPGQVTSVATNGCIKVENGYPSWWDTRTMQLQGQTGSGYSIPFTWSNTCIGSGGFGSFDHDWHSLFFGPISSGCATLINLQGDGTGTLNVTYWAN